MEQTAIYKNIQSFQSETHLEQNLHTEEKKPASNKSPKSEIEIELKKFISTKDFSVCEHLLKNGAYIQNFNLFWETHFFLLIQPHEFDLLIEKGLSFEICGFNKINGGYYNIIKKLADLSANILLSHVLINYHFDVNNKADENVNAFEFYCRHFPDEEILILFILRGATYNYYDPDDSSYHYVNKIQYFEKTIKQFDETNLKQWIDQKYSMFTPSQKEIVEDLKNRITNLTDKNMILIQLITVQKKLKSTIAQLQFQTQSLQILQQELKMNHF